MSLSEQKLVDKIPTIDSSATPKDILLMNTTCRRLEYINVSQISSEAALVDEEHVLELKTSMEKQWGQTSPITVRARLDKETNAVIYDVIDGFHRSSGMKQMAQSYNQDVFAEAAVLYGCTDDELFDLRVLSATTSKTVKFARTIEWMQKSFMSTTWENPRLGELASEGKLTLSQIFSLAQNDSSGKILRLTLDEAEELKSWAIKKAETWSKTLGTLVIETRTAEVANPTLIKQVRIAVVDVEMEKDT